jgi:hypothetical protein
MLTLIGTLVTILLVAPLLFIAAVGVSLLVASKFPSTTRVRETFRCPWTRKVVTVDFLVPDGASHPSDVVSCTAFPNPEEVTCKKPCRDFAETTSGPSRAIFPRWALTAGGLVTWRDADRGKSK